MILDNKVEIVLHNKTINYYESLGYNIPRYIYKKYKLKVKRGTKILIKIEDLLPKSNVKVLCKCDNCGVEKMVTFQNIKRYNENYFCHICVMGLDKTKNKLKESHKGIFPSNETKKKMSENSYCLGKFGENNPLWDFNKTERERKLSRCIPGIYKWKREVKERDKYTCQCCGSKEKLRVHHLENFADNKNKRIDINNGVTMCENCHKKFHKIYGNRNTNKRQFQEFLQ